MDIEYKPNPNGYNPTRLKFKRELEKVLSTAPRMCGTCVMCVLSRCVEFDSDITRDIKYAVQGEDGCPKWRGYDADSLYPEDQEEIPF